MVSPSEHDLLLAIAALTATVLLVLLWFVISSRRASRQAAADTAAQLAEQHRAMLGDVYGALQQQGDRVISQGGQAAERLRQAVGGELGGTREAMHQLRQAMLGETMKMLAEQGRADRELLQSGMAASSLQLAGSIESLMRAVNERLEQISGHVNERLDEGFRKTNETFVNVMARLATIDEAQKKIDGLTSNVVSLQELLGDKRARGAFGEVQLEGTGARHAAARQLSSSSTRCRTAPAPTAC